jgi:hypothetical protein
MTPGDEETAGVNRVEAASERGGRVANADKHKLLDW